MLRKEEKTKISIFIRRMRKNCGLTQHQLAQLMGTTQCRISQVECSKDIELPDFLNVIEVLISKTNYTH